MTSHDKKDQHSKNPAHDTSSTSQSASHASQAKGEPHGSGQKASGASSGQGSQGQTQQGGGSPGTKNAPPSGPQVNVQNPGSAGPGNVNPPPSADKPPMDPNTAAGAQGPLGAGGAMVSRGPQAGDGGEPMPGQDAMGHTADGTETTTNLNANNPPGVSNPENMTAAPTTRPEPGQEPLLSHHGQPLQNPNG